MPNFRRLLAGALLCAPLAAQAQAIAVPRPYKFNLSGGFTFAQPKSGLMVNGGFSAATNRAWATLLPIELTFVPGTADPRYYQDTFSNGQTRCRDSQTGQFASNTKCQAPIGIKYSGALEANVQPSLHHPIFVGAGFHAGYARTAYGTIGLIRRRPNGTGTLLRISAGASFLQLALGGYW